MVRGCFVPLAIWGGLWASYTWLLTSILDGTSSFVVAGFTSVMVVGFLGAIVEGRTAWRCHRAISRALRQEPLSDGRLTAIIGEILPLDEPARTPFSDEACILCEYSIKRPDANADASSATPQRPHFGVDVSGYIMNPCVIRSGDGELRLAGFPQMEGFDCQYLTLPSHVRAARQWIQAGEHDSVGLRILRLAKSLAATYADDDGHVRRKFLMHDDPLSLFHDTESFENLPDELVRNVFRLLDAADEDEQEEVDRDQDEGCDDDDSINEIENGQSDQSGDDETGDDEADDVAQGSDEEDLVGRIRRLRERLPRLAETVVPVGARVCALGVYSAERRMLVTRVGLTTDYTRLYAGDVTDVESQLRTSSRQKLLGGTIALVVVHAILILALVLGGRAQENDKQAGVDGDVRPVIRANHAEV